MKHILIIALALTACQTAPQRAFYLAAPIHSQAEHLNALGLARAAYAPYMRVVPCIRWENGDPWSRKAVPMTVQERLREREEHGGHLAACGVRDDTVWG